MYYTHQELQYDHCSMTFLSVFRGEFYYQVFGNFAGWYCYKGGGDRPTVIMHTRVHCSVLECIVLFQFILFCSKRYCPSFIRVFCSRIYCSSFVCSVCYSRYCSLFMSSVFIVLNSYVLFCPSKYCFSFVCCVILLCIFLHSYVLFYNILFCIRLDFTMRQSQLQLVRSKMNLRFF